MTVWIGTADDEHWMRRALSLAERAQREFDEIPVGAVLVGADGRLLGEGWNRNIAEHDPSAHAEIVALRQAGRALGNHRLCGSVFDLVADPRHNHRVEVVGGVLAEEAGRRLSNYFRAKRGKPPLA